MTAERRAFVVVDLGFGDAGKGTTTDALVQHHGATLVIRANGGAQAGHNVVTADGRHHTFSQFGAGTFTPGVRTHLADGMVVHPGALLVEARHLERKGVPDALERFTVDERARVITPFQQAAGRLRELMRGEERHGSCGIGFGEAVADALERRDDVIRMRHLRDGRALERLLRAQQERKREELKEARKLTANAAVTTELSLLEDRDAPARAAEVFLSVGSRVQIVDGASLGSMLRDHVSVVFEGAQGVLLDETWGFHPHTTWSDCTFRAPSSLLAEHGYGGEVLRLGVLRAYHTRHGAGPFPTEDATWSALLTDAHNRTDDWQGAFRTGPLDGVLLRYALEVCGGVDALAVTCLDRMASLPALEVVTGYRDAGRMVARLEPGAPEDLEHRAGLGRRLRSVQPQRDRLVGDAALLEWVEACASRPAWMCSRGPTAAEKEFRPSR